MIILSRLLLNSSNRDVRSDLANCQALHRRLLDCFEREPSKHPRLDIGILYRLDLSRSGIVLLVQSQVQPIWTKLPQDYLMDDPRSVADKPIDHLLDNLKGGMILQFRLRANPTRKVCTHSRPDGTKNNGKRVHIHGDTEKIDWLKRKGEQAGFELATIQSYPEGSAVPNVKIIPEADRSGERNNQKLTFASALFEGMLVVIDPNLFRTSIAVGIGSAKAYGFGLLSLAVPRTLNLEESD